MYIAISLIKEILTGEHLFLSQNTLLGLELSKIPCTSSCHVFQRLFVLCSCHSPYCANLPPFRTIKRNRRMLKVSVTKGYENEHIGVHCIRPFLCILVFSRILKLSSWFHRSISLIEIATSLHFFSSVWTTVNVPPVCKFGPVYPTLLKVLKNESRPVSKSQTKSFVSRIRLPLASDGGLQTPQY